MFICSVTPAKKWGSKDAEPAQYLDTPGENALARTLFGMRAGDLVYIPNRWGVQSSVTAVKAVQRSRTLADAAMEAICIALNRCQGQRVPDFVLFHVRFQHVTETVVIATNLVTGACEVRGKSWVEALQDSMDAEMLGLDNDD
jgi:hypothetical protein